MDKLASEETEWGKRLHEEDGGCREAAISQQASKAIKECEIVLVKLVGLPMEGKGMSEATPQAIPDSPPKDVDS